MAAIAQTDVAVTITPRDMDIVPLGKKQMVVAQVAFGDGALTYPAGGVPLPAKERFGFKHQVDFVAIQEPVANGFHYKYDPATHKVKIFTQGFATGATAAAVNENGAKAKNSAGTEGTPRIPNTASNTTYDMGGMIELPASIAPAAATLKLLMFGE
ncbi:MAG: hypothetical protein AB1921_14570 [Thermodesulfobacteriota bacterium]